MKITKEIKMQIHNDVYLYGNYIINSNNFQLEKRFLHHKYSTAYQHSIHVAEIALEIMYKFHISQELKQTVIKIGLLHDYYLYDWHNKSEKWHKPHIFKHPKIAANNAIRDFGLTAREENSIKHHMWPVTPIPPRYREGWIITIADKIATFRERFKRELCY